MNIVLWIIQILLALLFAFAGVSKFLMPAEEMAANTPPFIPIWFIYFIGVAEALGAIGLVVPWLTGIKPSLTPIAAWCLFIIMVGATAITAMGQPSMAVMPLVVGILCAVVGFFRRKAV